MGRALVHIANFGSDDFVDQHATLEAKCDGWKARFQSGFSDNPRDAVAISEITAQLGVDVLEELFLDDVRTTDRFLHALGTSPRNVAHVLREVHRMGVEEFRGYSASELSGGRLDEMLQKGGALLWKQLRDENDKREA